MTTKSPTRGLILGSLLIGIAGCVAPGRVYDDSKVALIQREATTEAELLQWFGPASARNLAPDGTRTLSWRFAPSKSGHVSSGRLEVRLSPDGKVTSYSAAGEPR